MEGTPREEEEDDTPSGPCVGCVETPVFLPKSYSFPSSLLRVPAGSSHL